MRPMILSSHIPLTEGEKHAIISSNQILQVEFRGAARLG